MTLIVLLALGRLVIWTIQTNGLTRPIFRVHPKLEELRECDFCLGFWVMTPLAWLFGVDLLSPLHIPILGEILTGLGLSFALHIGRLGWQEKFGITYLGDD